MFLEFVVKGAKCHEDMAHSAFLGQFCVEAFALVPITKCLTCRVTKKISNKLHQRALTMILNLLLIFAGRELKLEKDGPTFQVSVHVTCSPFKIVVYYIDTSVLLENIPLIKFRKTTSGT